MFFDEILECLKADFDIISYNKLSNVNIYSALLLDNTQENLSSNLVYIGKASECKKPCNAFNLILTEDSDLPDWLYMYNYVYIRHDSVSDVFNFVQTLLSNQFQFESTRASMLDMFVNGKDLMTIVNSVKKELIYPTVIMDVRGRVLAHTDPFELNDATWQENITNGYCSIAFMNHIFSRQAENTSNSISSFMIKCESTDLVYLCSRLYINNELFGFVFMFQHNSFQFQSLAVQMLSLVRDIAKNAISHSSKMTSLGGSSYSALISDIFSGMSKSEISARARDIGGKFPEKMRLFLIRPKYFRDDQFMFSNVISKLKSLYPLCISLVYENNVVLILDEETYSYGSSKFLDLAKYSESENLIIGVGSTFTDITDIVSQFNLVNDTINCGKLLGIEDNTYMFSLLSFYTLLSKIPNKTILKSYCHPAISILKEYDKANTSNLYETLKVYVNTCFNSSKTSDILFLHRNSLNYRLKKISELCNIDFTKSELLFNLIVSFKIDLYMQNIDQ